MGRQKVKSEVWMWVATANTWHTTVFLQIHDLSPV